MDGESFLPLIHNPEWNKKNEAFSYFRNGITLRTERYRLTRYFRDEQPTIELYDHQKDPLESDNIAELNPDIIDKLMPVLERGNTGLYD